MSDSILTVRDLVKDFDEGAVLEGVDLDVAENETTVLMGPNGAGKTILLACMAGGLFPDEGEIDVLGETPSAARSKLSFLIQGGLGLPMLTGRENVDFYSELHPAATDGWTDIVDRMNLDDDLDRPVEDYSGGMVRKLELAISLSVDVPLYLLDEPTAELDLTTIDQLHSILESKKDEGKTVVMTSHTPLDVEVADRVVFVQYGRAVAEGDPQALLDEVPEVVRVVGTADFEAISEHVRGGRLFDTGDGRRGFLQNGTDVDELREVATRGDRQPEVELAEASYTDLFNYYTRIAPEK
ncbi:ABC transporter ATP-binding protein [Halobacteriales archaeon QS_1_68_20]|nr:MAG: ABC transporter ATP-binding protein [Halobacteriales archaeon QS_1_68_20]